MNLRKRERRRLRDVHFNLTGLLSGLGLTKVTEEQVEQGLQLVTASFHETLPGRSDEKIAKLPPIYRPARSGTTN
jgi:hypothetical protein